MNIEIMNKIMVDNPTEFDKGDTIGFIGNELNATFIVVGENHVFLHAFCIQNGDYVGINKNPLADNLKQIELISTNEVVK